MKKFYFILFPLLISSCATTPDYVPVVDTSDIQKNGTTIIFDKEKYAKDYQECQEITNNVDYSDEKTIAALKGAEQEQLLNRSCNSPVRGVVMAPVVIPIYEAAMLIGGGSNVNATREEAEDESYCMEFLP